MKFKFNIHEGFTTEQSRALIDRIKHAAAHSCIPDDLPIFPQRYMREKAHADMEYILMNKRYFLNHQEHVLGAGEAYDRSLFLQLDQEWDLPFLTQILNGDYGIDYLCDGLYTIDWDKLQASADELRSLIRRMY